MITADEVLNDQAASFWLKEQIKNAMNRDIIDAINDTEILLEVLNELNRKRGVVQKKL
ncbi:hypothetical protein [Psychromonas sp. KJ10-2]|uniref:hypothetical protein n=1 Tax=Psychromonas sp. KJ10-2 TaxID=3391822 RepID=UPI0039B3C2D9